MGWSVELLSREEKEGRRTARYEGKKGGREGRKQERRGRKNGKKEDRKDGWREQEMEGRGQGEGGRKGKRNDGKGEEVKRAAKGSVLEACTVLGQTLVQAPGQAVSGE